MKITIKIVLWKDIKKATYLSFCPYVPPAVGTAKNSKIAIQYTKKYIVWELEDRFNNLNLKKEGWKIEKDNTIPPKISNNQAIRKVENIIGYKIPNPKIIEVEIEVPRYISR